MIIPGFFITWATFPGVVVHETAHLLMCRLRRVPVFDVCFFRFGNPAGYVVHAPAPDFRTHLLIAVGPFLLNSLLCIAICLPVLVPRELFGYHDPLAYVLLWLGLSIGMNSFPSTGDAASLWGAARTAAAQWNILAILTLPLVIVIYIANILRIVWLDLIYGVAIGLGLPMLIIKALL